MAFDIARCTASTRTLAGIATATDGEIQTIINTQALPKVRLYLLTATDAAGQRLLFVDVRDFSDSVKVSATEALADSIMEEPTIKDGFNHIVAVYAAAIVIRQKFSIISEEAKLAQQLNKEAKEDLLQMVKSPNVKAAAIAALARFAETSGLGVGAAVYLMSAVNPATVNTTTKTFAAYAGAQLPYVGAPDAGKISAIVNGVAVEATVALGDTPVQIGQKLTLALEAMASNTRPNVNLLPSEMPVYTGQRNHTYTDGFGNSVTETFSYEANMGKIVLLPRKYDPEIDVAVVTVSLLSRKSSGEPNVWVPGIAGLVYGQGSSGSQLTKDGPYAMAVNLDSGKATSLTYNSTARDSTSPVSDSLFFETAAPTAAAGVLTYRINDTTVQSVAIPIASSAIHVVELLAQDLANKAATQRVLGAVRPSALITVNGSPQTSPSIELIAFGVERSLSRVMLTVLSVPAGVVFGVVPPTLITQANFDAGAKSVVIKTTLAKDAGALADDDGLVGTPSGNVKLAQHVVTGGLSRILTDLMRE
jgi:hypothetical protein